MSEQVSPPAIVLALAEERDAYRRGPHPDKMLAVDEQLALRGWCVTSAGVLVHVDSVKPKADPAPVPDPDPEPERDDVEPAETTAVEPAPENTAAAKPKRGPGRPRRTES